MSWGRRTFSLPSSYPSSKPKIREALRNAAEAEASLFYQLMSGHSLTAPFVVNHVIAPDISVICGDAEERLADGAVGDRVL